MSIRGRDKKQAEKQFPGDHRPVENQPRYNRYSSLRWVAAKQCKFPYGSVTLGDALGTETWELAGNYECFVATNPDNRGTGYSHGEMAVMQISREADRGLAQDLAEAACYPLD